MCLLAPQGGCPQCSHSLPGRGGGQTLLVLRWIKREREKGGRGKRGREGGRLSCKLGYFHSSAQIASKNVLKVVGTEEIVERVRLMGEGGGGEGGVNEVCGRGRGRRVIVCLARLLPKVWLHKTRGGGGAYAHVRPVTLHSAGINSGYL